MNRRTRIVKIISMIFVIVVFVASVSNFLLNKCLYTYDKDLVKTQAIWSSISQTLFKDINYITYDNMTASKFGFGDYTLNLNTYYAENKAAYNVKVKNKFGKISADKKVDNLITKQKYFLSANELNNKFAEKEETNKFYKVSFGVPETEYEMFINELKSCFSYDYYKNNEINWIAVKSSDDSEAVTIGIPAEGNRVVADVQAYSNIRRYPTEEYIGQYSYIRNSLLYLQSEKEEINKIMDSKIFGDIDIDYYSKLDYILENGIKVIGFVGYFRYNDIAKIMEKTNYKIIEYSEC